MDDINRDNNLTGTETGVEEIGNSTKKSSDMAVDVSTAAINANETEKSSLDDAVVVDTEADGDKKTTDTEPVGESEETGDLDAGDIENVGDTEDAIELDGDTDIEATSYVEATGESDIEATSDIEAASDTEATGVTEATDEKEARIMFSSPDPYPKVEAEEPNPYYARLLMDDYCGAASEMTAINQYNYHSFATREHREYFESFFEGIAETEMRHFEMLSQVIVQLGGIPVYRGGASTQGSWWTGRLVYYGHSLCDRLRADLEAERQAIRSYENKIRIIRDKNVQAVLSRIILDEKVHAGLLEEAIAKYCI